MSIHLCDKIILIAPEKIPIKSNTSHNEHSHTMNYLSMNYQL